MKTKILAILCLISCCILFSCGDDPISEQGQKEEKPGHNEENTEGDKLTTPEATIHPDSVEVRFSDIIYIDSEPLETRSSNNNDLYAVQVVKQVPMPAGDLYYFESVTSIVYAHGCFDDLSKFVIKLAKRDIYGFTVAYIPNGKNVLYRYPDGHYGNPCGSVWGRNGTLNEIVYNDRHGLFGLEGGVSQAKDISDYMIQSNTWNSIERYQGVVADYDPKSGEPVNIKLYRMMMGFKVDISDFHSGTVTICSIHGHKYQATPDGNGNGSIDIVIETEIMPIAGDLNSFCQDYGNPFTEENKEIFNEYIQKRINESYTQLYIIYTTDKGEEIMLYANQYFRITRNTKYNLSFSLSEAIQNGTIIPDIVDDEEMAEKDFPL